MRHTLSVLLENKPGALTRVTSMFARRGYNIESLAVGPTERHDVSRITLRVAGAVSKAGEVAGDVQLVMASNDILDNLRKINADEIAGKMTPLEARRARAQALSAAIQMVAPMAGAFGAEAHVGAGVKEALAGRGPGPAEPALAAARRRARRRGRGSEEPPQERARRPAERGAVERSAESVGERGAVEGEHRGVPSEGAAGTHSPGRDLPASAEPREARPQAGAREEPSPAQAREPQAPRGGSDRRAKLEDAIRKAGGVIEELPNGSVISNLQPHDVRAVYENCIAAQPDTEVGIWYDPHSGEYVVVQGGDAVIDGRVEKVVDTSSVLYKDPDFAEKSWRMVEHYHPGEHLTARLPSAEDFDVITHWQRQRREPPGPISSTVRYVDPVTKKPATTTFGFTPGVEEPYYIKYKATDGSPQHRTFRDPPFEAGSDFRRFSETFTGRPSDRVPEPRGAAEPARAAVATHLEEEPVTLRRPDVGPGPAYDEPSAVERPGASARPPAAHDDEPVTLRRPDQPPRPESPGPMGASGGSPTAPRAPSAPTSGGPSPPKSVTPPAARSPSAPKGMSRGRAAPKAPLDVKDWPVTKIDPTKPLPDLPGPGERRILEFPGGQRVWRTLEGKIAQQGKIGPSLGKRAHTEDVLPTQAKGNVVGPPQERAHTRGQGLGFESPYGIYYAPTEVNQALQNHGIEKYLSELRAELPPHSIMDLRTETATQWGTRRLSEITYAVDLIDARSGEKHPFLEFKIHIGGTRTTPRIHIDPVEFAKNPVAHEAEHTIDVPKALYTGLKPLPKPPQSTP